VQTCLANALRTFLLKKDFIEIHTPKLIATASESGSEVFEISNYFDKKAYLAQSPQFYKQMAITGGLERVFEVGPVFRAEKSRSNRHATEFTGFDLEFTNVRNVTDVMKFEEAFLKYGLGAVEKKYGKDIERLFNIPVNAPKKKMPIMQLSEIFKELAERYNFHVPPAEQTDLNAEGEKLAAQLAKEKFDSEFLFVVGYDKSTRPFYHQRDKKGVPQGFDLIYRGVEITSGAVREHRYDILKQQADEKSLAKDVEFYLQFFKYGAPPHGGFGIGLDRVTMLLLGLTLKEATLCFRGPDRLLP
jgi:aspartyl-tRNA synthetase